MTKTLLRYGLLLGVLSVVLKFSQYWFWIKLNAYDVYVLLVASLFLGAGLWLGRQLRRRPADSENPPESVVERTDTEGYAATLETYNISKREYEVLVLLGKGKSNREIADDLFVSPNTIKTHTSRLFEKLDVKNRTHAILKAKELGLIRD